MKKHFFKSWTDFMDYTKNSSCDEIEAGDLMIIEKGGVFKGEEEQETVVICTAKNCQGEKIIAKILGVKGKIKIFDETKNCIVCDSKLIEQERSCQYAGKEHECPIVQFLKEELKR